MGMENSSRFIMNIILGMPFSIAGRHSYTNQKIE